MLYTHPPPRSTSLLYPSTHFVGRRRELNEMAALLASPACRLLTLVGPGGIGKTRLALAAAAHAGFDDVIRVSLETVTAPAHLLGTVADALDLKWDEAGNLQDQVARDLHARAASPLLVLDGFEPVLAAAPRLARLLSAVPGLKLLVTTRRPLGLQEERLYRVDGLALPPDPAEWDQSDAVQLLVDRARRVRRDLAVEAEALVQICRLVEGTPLALELAAVWLKDRACTDVAAALREGMAAPRPPLPDCPPALHAVFDQAWQQLAPHERDVLMRLAVFHGGFAKRAAQAVAGASLLVLTTLVERGLVGWEPASGRYRIHRLLHHYAWEQLERTAEAPAQVRAVHALYYAEYVEMQADGLQGPQPQAAVRVIEVELPNLRAAWQWAVAQSRGDVLRRMAPSLALFYRQRGRPSEAAAILAQAGAP